MGEHRIYSMAYSSFYPALINKVEKKGRTRAELDQVICWATGYSQEELESQLEKQVDCRTFIEEAALNPDRELIKGVVCGVRGRGDRRPADARAALSGQADR